MRVLPAVVGLVLLARAGTATAFCGDGAIEPPDEQCDGGDCCSTGCQFEGAGTPCTDDGSLCTADVCDAGGICTHPAANAGMVCRPSAGVCDVEETCTGLDPGCPVDAKSTAPCRPIAGDCDVAETCDGIDDDCPADAFLPSTDECRGAAGMCDVAESCTGTDAACPVDGKSTAPCRPAAGNCDVEETCDGINDDCPPNEFVPSTVVCRPSAGVCDVEETCTGLDPGCPVDAKSTAPCRPIAGDCDVAETCDGVDDDCPADAFRPSTDECRGAAGMCDVAESCTGTDAACPVDGKSTAPCRPAAGNCDVEETCDGINDDCPPNEFVPSTVVCRPAAGPCDAEEHCVGDVSSCPPDGAQPNGTPCTDGDACTGTDTCQSGVCTGDDPVVCTPLDQCHVAGTCNAATGVCSNPPKGDGLSCDDANACTASDSCHAGVCDGIAVPGCCLGDGECDDGIACTADQCVAHRCMHAPLAERCGAPRACGQLLCAHDDPAADTAGCVVRAIDEGSYCTEDDDPCTIDACQSGACNHTSDRSGSRCLLLVPPYRTTLDLLARARTLETAIQAAAVAGCAGDTTCDLTPGQESTRLIALLGAAQQDFETAAIALAGRLAGPASPTTPRDPVVRARLALGLLSDTPTELRGFLATLAQARTRRLVARDFARARRGDARRLLTGTRKLRGQLLRLVARRQSFAR